MWKGQTLVDGEPKVLSLLKNPEPVEGSKGFERHGKQTRVAPI
jgi:hypothetical protein